MRMYGQVKGRAYREHVQEAYVKPTAKPQYWKAYRERKRAQFAPEGHMLCRRCLKVLPIEDFEEGGMTYKTCNSCRERKRSGK